MRRAALQRAAIFLAAAMAAAGCTTSSSPNVPPIGPMITRPAGPGPAVARAEQRVHCGTSQRAIPLPAGFVAAAAVLCPLTLRRLHGPAHVVSRKQVADHGLAPLVAALRRPPEHLPPGTVCAAQAVAVPLLFLISAAGQIIRPVIPSDGCGRPQQQALDALQRLPWVTTHASGHP
jgi:hypothetical protein